MYLWKTRVSDSYFRFHIIDTDGLGECLREKARLLSLAGRALLSARSKRKLGKGEKILRHQLVLSKKIRAIARMVLPIF